MPSRNCSSIICLIFASVAPAFFAHPLCRVASARASGNSVRPFVASFASSASVCAGAAACLQRDHFATPRVFRTKLAAQRSLHLLRCRAELAASRVVKNASRVVFAAPWPDKFNNSAELGDVAPICIALGFVSRAPLSQTFKIAATIAQHRVPI